MVQRLLEAQGMKIHFRYSESHDWMALYVDGKAVYQGHDINEKMLLDYLGIDYTSEDIPDEEVEGRFPETMAGTENIQG